MDKSPTGDGSADSIVHDSSGLVDSCVWMMQVRIVSSRWMPRAGSVCVEKIRNTFSLNPVRITDISGYCSMMVLVSSAAISLCRFSSAITTTEGCTSSSRRQISASSKFQGPTSSISCSARRIISMLSPKRCWELSKRTRGFDIVECEKPNKLSQGYLKSRSSPILPHPAFGMKKE